VEYSHPQYQSLQLEYTFRPGTDRLDLDTRLVGGGISNTTTIGGVVGDLGNAPVAGAVVEIIAPAGDAGNRTVSDARGVYRLEGIKAQTFVVRYSHSAFDPLEREYTFQQGSERLDLETRLSGQLQSGRSPQYSHIGLTVKLGSGVPASEGSEAERMLRFAQQAVTGIYGVQNDNIFVGIYRDVEEMLDVYMPFLGLPSSQRDRWRDTFGQFPGFSGYRAIWRGVWNGGSWTQQTWVHEYTHTLQWELSQNAAGGRAARWLEEGHATLVDERVINRTSTDRWRQWTAGLTYQLRDIEGERIFSVRHGYILAGFACEYLRLQYGDAAMMTFWREAAASEWHTAFQTAFGISVDAFYEHFERFRAGS
jgi:hypothetical protein